jgi:transposase-like protein
MPWRASTVTEERLRFVARLLEGEAMTDVCRDFGISRKTGYKIFNRYRDQGLEALCDRSRRPVRYANQLPEQIGGVQEGASRAVAAHSSPKPVEVSHAIRPAYYALAVECDRCDPERRQGVGDTWHPIGPVMSAP